MATTSLGRLTLDLAVRLSEFVDGMTRAERETRERTERMTDSVNSFRDNLTDALGGTQLGGVIDSLNSRLGSLGGSIGTVAGGLAGMAIGGAVAATGAMAKLAIETAKADVEMAVLAKRSKTSVESFQVLERAAAQLGVTQEQLGSILADTQEKLGEFTATEGGEAADFFDAVKNNTSLTNDEIKKLAKTLQGKEGVGAIQDMKDQLDALGATSQEQRFIFESFANDLGNLLPLFADGGKLLKEYGKELEDAGVIKSEAAIEQSRRLAAQTQALQTRYDGLKQQLAAQMMPTLNNLIGYFVDGSKKGNQFGGIVKSIGVVAKGTAITIIALATGISALVGAFSTIYDQFYNVGQTGRAFWEADGIPAKLAALEDGIARGGRINAKGANDIISYFKQGYSAGKSILNDTITQGDALSSVMYELQDASIAAGSGLAVSTAEAKENEKALKELNKTKKAGVKATKELSRMEQVHAAFVKAGMSDNQARIMTAEVGREGSFLDKNLFGFHKDPKNSAINAGMISWQGDRGKALIKELTSLGLFKNGKIVPSQEALDAQAAFVVKEMLNDKHYKRTKEQFLLKPDVSYDKGKEVLGRDYIRWAYDNKNFASGHKNRDKFYNQINAKKGNKGLVNDLVSQAKEEQKVLEEQQRAAEKLAQEQQSIRERYMNEREKSVYEHNKKLAEIDAKFGQGSVEAVKYRAEEKARYQEEQAARVYSIMSKYQSEEEKLEHEFQQTKQEIRNKFAEDSPEYAIAMDRLEVFHREELQKIRQQDAEKYIQQQQHIDGIRRLMQQSSYESAATVGDIIARNTMKPDDYQRYSLGGQEDSARAGVNAQYADREAEINRINELGEYEIASAGARYELLQEAKREHEEAMYAVDFEYADKRKKLEEDIQVARLDMYAGTTSAMSGLLGAFFGENKRIQAAMFAIEKGYTLAGIWLKHKSAIADAWATPGSVWQKAAAAAQVAMETGALAAAAGAITPVITGGIAHGGLDYVPKESTYLLDKGERVLSPRQNQDLAKFMQGGNSGKVIIHNYSGEKAEAKQDMDGNTIVVIGKMVNGIVDQKLAKFKRQEQRQGGLFSGA